MQFVLLDHQTTPLSQADMNLTRDSLDEYMQIVAEEWGGSYAFRIGKSPTDRLQTEIGINIRDSIPEAPDAVAYHTVMTNGVPDIEMGMNNVDSIARGSDSLICALSHECAETAVDPGGNQYAELLDGTTKARAKEASDRVQNITFRLTTGADASDFLLQSAFIPGAIGPWDYVSRVTGANLMANQSDYSNGYDVEAVITGDHQLFPDRRMVITSAKGHENLSPLALNRKRGAHSRTSRRGVRL
jgi:hypothetical protein